MVESSSQLGHFPKVFDFNRLLVYHELAPNLRHRFHPHHADLLSCREMLHDFVQVDLAFLCKNEQSVLSERSLSHFGVFREGRDFHHVASFAVADAFYLDGGHF